jgi:phage N-6-adenine-methyltransferase
MSARKIRQLAMQHPVAVREDWETPPAVFGEWDARFGFTLDVCATPENAKVPRYLTPAENGLAVDWGAHVCWMNPPFGREIPQWMLKAHIASLGGATVVCLVPARVDTRWWHEIVQPHADEIHFVRGRIRFVGARYNAPFPCAVIVFHGVQSVARGAA